MAKPAKKAPLAQRAAANTPAGRALLKRALKDPGLRSKLPANLLPAGPVRQQRALNTRLNAPVTPGSSMTERQLARSSNLQAQVKYAPAQAELGRQTVEAQQQVKDVGGFYDQYLAKLAQNQRDVSTIQQSANDQLAATAGGITGLSVSGLQSLQSAANADATARGATAGDQTKLASDAAATRQALMGSFQAKQILQGAAANTYASGMTDRVAPIQKLSAVAQEQGRVRKLRDKSVELATEKGTFAQQQREAGRADEAKSVLAKSIATGKDLTAAANLAETVRKNKAGEKLTGAKIEADATQKQATADAKAAAAAAKAHEPNKYGVPADQWAKWSTSHRQRVMDTKAGKSGKGPDWVPQGQMGTALTQLTGLKSAASKAKAGESFVPGHGKQTPADRRAAGQKILGFGPIASKLKDPILVTAALDAVYDGHLSGATVKALIKAGYKPGRVAQTLGVPTGRPGSSTYAKPKKPAVTGSRADSGR